MPGTEKLTVATEAPGALGLNTIETVQDFPAASGRLLQPSDVTTNWESMTATVTMSVSVWPGLTIVKSWAGLLAPTATVPKSPAPFIVGPSQVTPTPRTVATTEVIGKFASVTVKVRTFEPGLVGLNTTMIRHREFAASGPMHWLSIVN